MSTFEIGIPAKRRVSTTSKRKSLRLAGGNVVPLAFSCLSCHIHKSIKNFDRSKVHDNVRDGKCIAV